MYEGHCVYNCLYINVNQASQSSLTLALQFSPKQGLVVKVPIKRKFLFDIFVDKGLKLSQT